MDTTESDNDDTNFDILLKKLKQSFNIDQSYSDMVDKNDLYKLYNSNNIQIDKNIINIIFNTIDIDNNGYIDINKYLSWKNELDLQSLQELINDNNNNNNSNNNDDIPPSYVGQSSLAIDELPETDDDHRSSLMKNSSNTKTMKEIVDLESNTPPSTQRMTTNDTQVSDISNNTNTQQSTPINLLKSINEHDNIDIGKDNNYDQEQEEEEEKYSQQIQKQQRVKRERERERERVQGYIYIYRYIQKYKHYIITTIMIS